MNTSSRVPGITRNSGWHAVDAEIASSHLDQRHPYTVRPTPDAIGAEPGPLSPECAAQPLLLGLRGAGASSRVVTSSAGFPMALAG